MRRIRTILYVLVVNTYIALASTGVGKLYYNLDNSTFTAEVTFCGSFLGACYYKGDIVIPSQITFNGKKYTVTSIGNSAFNYCEDLTSVTIPHSVISIDESAFRWGCPNLTSVTINSPTVAERVRAKKIFGEQVNEYILGDSVKSIGWHLFEGCTNLSSITISNSVTSIGSGAFEGCTSLTTMTMPNSVTSIERGAFLGCSSLSSPIFNSHLFAYLPTSYIGEYVIPDNIESIAPTAFYDCTGMNSVVIPNTVTNIGSGAFTNCSNLNYLDIPSNVTCIQDSAFKNCTSLTSITIPETISFIGSLAFAGCNNLHSLTISAGITEIWNEAFANCTGLISVIFPNSVTSIGEGAFAGCTGLTSVTIPDSVINIGDYAFYDCSGLTSINIPNSVTSIGYGAFKGCMGFTSINIPNSVTSIGDGAFDNCTNLTSVTLNSDSIVNKSNSVIVRLGSPINYFLAIFGDQVSEYIIGDSVTGIGPRAFAGCTGLTSVIIGKNVKTIGGGAFSGCTGLISVNIPNNVTNMEGSGVFSYCSNLTSVTLSDSITRIGNWAFAYCSGLTSFSIPNGVTSIGNLAFLRCYGLTSVTIPQSVTSIENQAFSECTNLTSVTIEAEIPPIIGQTNIFYKDSLINIYIPCGSMDAYMKKNNNRNQGSWTDFSERIQYKPFPYNLNISSNIEQGTIEKSGENTICDTILTLTATSDYGYHFVQWNDNITENPRIVVLYQDTTFTAEFAINKYSVTTSSNIATAGITVGDTVLPYLDSVELQAIPNYGYNFYRWSDGVIDNPRIVVLTQDTILTAIFSPITFTITWQNEDGTIIEQTSEEYGQVPSHEDPTKPATPQYSYTFAGWTPEIVAVTGDATYTATYDSIVNKYTITFLNDDGSILCSDAWEYGTMPSCGEPSKADNEQYTYTFAGWTPEIVAVAGEATYTATYTATAKPEGFEDVNADVPIQKIFRDSQFYILRGEKVYTITGNQLR